MNLFNDSLDMTSDSYNTKNAFCGPFFDYQIQDQAQELYNPRQGILCFYKKRHQVKLNIQPHEHIDLARIDPIQALMKHKPNQLPPCLWAVKDPFSNLARSPLHSEKSIPIPLSNTGKVKHVLYPIQSHHLIKQLKKTCDNMNQVMIADGHHRFEAFMRDPVLSVLPVVLMPLDQLQVRRFHLWATLLQPYFARDKVLSIFSRSVFQPCKANQADFLLEWQQQQYPFKSIHAKFKQTLNCRDHIIFAALEAEIIKALSLSKYIDTIIHEAQGTPFVQQDNVIRIVFKPPCKQTLFKQACSGEKQPKKSTYFQNKPLLISTQYLYEPTAWQKNTIETSTYQRGF